MLKLLEILFNAIYIVGYNELFLGKQKMRSLWQVEKWRGFKESKRKQECKLSARQSFLKITCKLFKHYREPSKGAFHFPQRGKEIPN